MPTASLRVTFGSGPESGHLSAEIDSREDGPNHGKLSFMPGDTVYFLVYCGPDVAIDRIEASAGSVNTGEQIVITREDDIEFSDTDTAILPVPTDRLETVTWYGADLGTITLDQDLLTLRVQQKGVAIAHIKYETKPWLYALTSPASINGQYDFSILVLIVGKKNAD